MMPTPYTAAIPMEDAPVAKRTLLALAVEIIAEAAEIVMDIRAHGFRTEIKPDCSLVTEADKASEAHILQRLRQNAPEIAAISEEEAAAGIYVPHGDLYWLIDPLDGTNGFASGSRNFAINIGLIHRDSPVLGAVALPAHAQIYTGGQGLDAVRHDAEGTSPLHVAQPAPEGLRILRSSHHHSDCRLKEWLNGQPIKSIEPMGSAAKIMRIAEGSADFYPRFGPTMEWDTAAPQAILEAAGGQLLEENGTPLRYGKPGWKNPPFYCTGYQNRASRSPS